MNEKNNKKSNSVLNQKNLTVIGITAVAVVLLHGVYDLLMPKSTETIRVLTARRGKRRSQRRIKTMFINLPMIPTIIIVRQSRQRQRLCRLKANKQKPT